MEREDAVLLKVGHVCVHGLESDQVDGDRVAAEGVDRQHVKALEEPLLRLPLEGDPGVSLEDVHVCAALLGVRQEREGRLGPVHNLRIELVEREVVGGQRFALGGVGLPVLGVRVHLGVAVRGDRAHSEADDPGPKLPAAVGSLGVVLNRNPDSGLRPEVRRRPVPIVQQLAAVVDPAVGQRDPVVFSVSVTLLDREGAVEVADLVDHAALLVGDLPAEGARQGQEPEGEARRRAHAGQASRRCVPGPDPVARAAAERLQ